MDRDDADGQRVAIINETTAKTHWRNEDPLGKRFKFGEPGDDAPWLTVVGIVADTRRAGVDRPVFTESYQPYTQDPRPMTVLIRTAGEPAAIAPALRAVVRELDQDQPLAGVAPLDELIVNQTAARRFSTWLLGAFGMSAIALTAIGLYSLLAYFVALRRHEMAERLAIGGSPRHVLGLMVRHVSLVVGLGISLGLAGALTTRAVDARPALRDRTVGSSVSDSSDRGPGPPGSRGGVDSDTPGHEGGSRNRAPNRVVQSASWSW